MPDDQLQYAESLVIAYSVIGVAMLAYVMLVSNFSAVYATVGVSALFGSYFTRIYTGTPKTAENRYTEVAGAVIVMSIVAASIVQAPQGYVSDYLGSIQRSFDVSLLCFPFVGYYFWEKLYAIRSAGVRRCPPACWRRR